ncbi:MAG: lipoyl synthase [Chloroflexi bacterium]|nr:lipoyl synthase [Chloroflexota bacterium]
MVQRPDWLRVRVRNGPNFRDLKQIMQDLTLHTICEEAHCPNITECWEYRTATFLILGDTCTRRCAYCAVQTGLPRGLDLEEPERLAQAVQRMGLKHVVITSVTRDDLPDGGAMIFAACIHKLHQRIPGCNVEVLIPDFKGSEAALATVMRARPDVLNHNIETVPRLFPKVRAGGRYQRSIELLARAKELAPDIPTKSGMMVGLGETYEEILAVMADLRDAEVDLLTIGQYLRPKGQYEYVPMARYYHPREFQQLKEEGLRLGFKHVESGPLVRSSYHAHQQVEAMREETSAQQAT